MQKKDTVFVTLFSSVKLTVILLLIIAVASVCGTIIPQGEAAETLMARLDPAMLSILQALQLFDIFHSVWFMILLGLLCINLIVCSVKRFPVSFRQYRKEPSDKPPDTPADGVFTSQLPASEETARLTNLLRKRYRRITRTEGKGEILMHADRGRLSYFGAYVIHLGILVIIGGAIAGLFGGFDAYITVGEGQSSDTVYLKGGKGWRKLDYALRCDRFSLEFYPDGTPKSYRSDLSFLKNGRIVFQGPVTVNHPLSFAGLRFYQADYGAMTHSPAALNVTDGRESLRVSDMEVGREFDLPGGGPRARILRVEADFMGMGPAVKVAIASPAGHLPLWIFQNIKGMEEANPGLLARMPFLDPTLFRPYRFSLSPRYYTGLQVNQDPGVPVVAAGSLLLIIGILMAFFHDHRQIWMRLVENREGTQVTIRGKSNKNTADLKRELIRIARKARKTGEHNA